MGLLAGALGCAHLHGSPVQDSSTRAVYTSADGSRAFVLFTPASLPRRGASRALVVMLHGCTQSADDLARGTRMNAAAVESGFLVLYPEQTVAAHPLKCWNWYTPSQYARNSGEAALLAGLIDSIARAEGVDARRVALVGMSAGAAMAANLVTAYPERYAALAMHSGLPALSAVDAASALSAMSNGRPDGDSLGVQALAAMGARARAIPVIALHGADDKVVVPANLEAVRRQWSMVNRGVQPMEEHLFAGVGHAWSGGSATGSYTAPAGPDATGLIVAFLSRAGVLPPR